MGPLVAEEAGVVNVVLVVVVAKARVIPLDVCWEVVEVYFVVLQLIEMKIGGEVSIQDQR